MSQVQFTDLAIQKLAPGLFMDRKTPGFGIRVGKHRKTWLVVRGKNRTKETIGHYPALSLSDARKRALVALGSERQPKCHVSFTEALEAFLALKRWRPQTLKVLKSSLRHFTWTRTLDKITHEDVAKALEAIPGPSARAHALKDIRTFFNWCVPRYLPASPAAGLKMEKQPTRARVLTDDELKAVWKAADGTFGNIVKLLILTAQRKMEIGLLRREYIHDDRVTLPPEIVKNGREHSFPLLPLAKSLIPQGEGFLFRASDGEGAYNGYTYHLKQLHKKSGTAGWTLHDLRRTAATRLAKLGVPIHVTEKLLNHASGTSGGLVGIYQRYDHWDEQVEALAKYEEFLIKLTSQG